MSTAGVHISFASVLAHPRVRVNMSSKSWFILFWMLDRSRKGSHQRTIAMGSLLLCCSSVSECEPARPDAPGRRGLTFRRGSGGHFDLLRLGRFLFRETDLQDAVLHLGA